MRSRDPHPPERSPALPRTAEGRHGLDGCVRVESIHAGPLVDVVRWRCLREGEALRSERFHTTFVLSLAEAGISRVHDGTWSTTVDPTNGVLHRPGSSYRTTHPLGCNDAGWSIAFRGGGVSELLDRHSVPARGWARPAIAVGTRPALPVLRQFVAVERSRRGLPYDSLALEELSFEILAALLRAGVRAVGATRPGHRRAVERAREFLNARFRDRVGLAEVAAAAGVSPAHLCRIFRQQAGPLDRVANECEFYSHSRLTASFTRELGCTPSAVRERLAPAARG